MTDPNKPTPKPAPPKGAAPAPARPAAGKPAAPAGAKPAAGAPVPGGAAAAPAPRKPTTAQQAAVAQAGQQPAEGEAPEEEIHSGGGGIFAALGSVGTSAIVHMILFIVLALITFTIDDDALRNILEVGQNEEVEELEQFEEEKIEVDVQVDPTTEITEQVQMVDVPQEVTEVTMANDFDAAALAVALSDFGEETAPKNDLLGTVGALTGTGFTGRGAAARGEMVRANGGTKGSEEAVARALKWFAEHQLPDGSWSFDHRIGPCNGRCPDQGNLKDARNGATAMALLPFLGAGQTHKEGTYKKNVQAGLAFLIKSMKVKPDGRGELSEAGGSMYSHGLAAIVLTEAYGMTHDRELMGPAQLSINHIVYARDPVGGLGRFPPRTPGDTSVVGWHLMARMSADMAYLNVPPQTIKGAVKFLDTVQEDSGSKYGYTGPGGGQATTAIGLLCRMYLGWKHDNGALQRGVEFLSKTGPSKGNMYYNYYATQVMRHYEGEAWEKWNPQMRDWLVDSQSKNGHTEGSWHMKGGDHGTERGGRLYCTSMATMILEVYYRHMPIYQKNAAEEDFPL